MNLTKLLRPTGAWLCLAAFAAVAAPLNDDFQNAVELPAGTPFTLAGSTVDATKEFDEPFAFDDWLDASVWWRWTPTTSGRILLETSDPDLNVLLGVFQGSDLGSLYMVAVGDDVLYPAKVNAQVRLRYLAGETYYLCVAGVYGDRGTFNLRGTELKNAPANDDFAHAKDLGSVPAIQVGASNRNATSESFEPYHAGQYIGTSVWWRWTAPASTNVVISTAGSTFDTLLAVYTGDSVDFLDEIASNDEASESDFTSSVRFKTVAGTTYSIVVDGYAYAQGDVFLSVTPKPPQKAPSWSLRDVDGVRSKWSDYAGKVVLLNFWATWCGPCRDEIPALIELQEQYGPEGFEVVGLSTDYDDGYTQTVRGFLGDYLINYDILLTEDSGVQQQFGGIPSIPTTFVINRDGEIVEKLVGSRSKETFEAQILPLLATVTPPPPPLVGTVTDGVLTLTWTDDGGANVVQQSARLDGSWQAAAGMATAADGLRKQSFEVSGNAMFFRLVPR